MKKLFCFLFLLISVRSFAQISGLIGSSGHGLTVGGAQAAPTVQASSITFSSVLDVSFTISWTNGDGNGRIVVVRSGSAINATPTDGIPYTSDTAFGSGDDLGSGSYVVYSGTGTSVSVTGLTIGTTYHVRIFEYTAASFKYLTISATGNPSSQATSTTPTTQSRDIVFSNVESTSMTVTFTRGSGSKVLVVVKAGSTISTNPSNNTTYTASATFGSGTQIGSGNYVVYASTGNSVTVTGLTFGQTYYARCYEYGGSVGSESYLTSTANENPANQAIDYLGATLIDEWIANYGITLRVNLGDYLDTWAGHKNGTTLTRSGSIPKPSGGVIPFNETGVPIFSNQGINVNGAVTFTFLLAKSATKGSRVELFGCASCSPSLRVNIESTGSTNTSILLNGVTYNSGGAFTYDGNYHALAYVINPAAGEFKCYMDGAQIGSTQTIPSTSIDLTSVNSKNMFGFQFTGNVKKFRIYNEAIDDTTIKAITNTANPFTNFVVTYRNARIYAFWGQSNMVGSGLVASDFPAYLQGTRDNVYTFETFAKYDFLPGTHPAQCGPEVKAIYDLQANYPNDDLFVIKLAAANTSLAVSWNSRTGGTNYNSIADSFLRVVNTLTAEGRTISEKSLFGMQGEEDAIYQVQADAYETNLTNFTDDFRSYAGITKHVYGRIHSHLPTSGSNARPYASTVRTAQDNVSTADANAERIDTDDNTAGNFELKSDNIHFNVTGQIKLGTVMASTLLAIP